GIVLEHDLAAELNEQLAGVLERLLIALESESPPPLAKVVPAVAEDVVCLTDRSFGGVERVVVDRFVGLHGTAVRALQTLPCRKILRMGGRPSQSGFCRQLFGIEWAEVLLSAPAAKNGDAAGSGIVSERWARAHWDEGNPQAGSDPRACVHGSSCVAGGPDQ